MTIHSPPALFSFFFLFVFCFVLEVEISSCTLIPLFMPRSVHSGSAGIDDGGRMFIDKLHVSSFPDRFPRYAWTAAESAHSDFFGSRVYACVGVNLPPAPLAE